MRPWMAALPRRKSRVEAEDPTYAWYLDIMLMNCPTFETKRLILREVMLEDRFDIFRNYPDPEVANWFFDEPFTDLKQSIEIIQEFIQKAEAGKGCTWAILLNETGEFLKSSGLSSQRSLRIRMVMSFPARLGRSNGSHVTNLMRILLNQTILNTGWAKPTSTVFPGTWTSRLTICSRCMTIPFQGKRDCHSVKIMGSNWNSKRWCYTIGRRLS